MRASSGSTVDASPRPAGRPRRSLRLIVVWLAIGMLAAAGSAVWASGFASASAEIGDTIDAVPVLASQASTTAPPQWIEAGGDPLLLDFVGAWAEVNADAHLFEVDLSDADPDHGFQVGVYSTADLDDSGWTDLQVLLVVADGPCDQADLGNPDASEALNLLASSDASWVLPLDGGVTACVGVPAAGRADDSAGTFARRASAATNPTPPTFTASANRIE